MEREIAFRGKSKSTGEWVEGYYVGDNTIIAYNEVVYDLGFIDTSPCHDCYPGSIGQFTGLYDKNGKEIYEGDIIIEKLRRARIDGERLVICFDDFEWQGKNENGSTTSLSLLVEYHTIEVIGNITDNEDLLKYGRN